MHNRTVSTGEEIANAITHGIGALLAVAALVVLIVMAAIHGSVWHIVSFSIFGATLVLLYFASTLYHSLTHAKAKRVFHKFDHISIYLLIAGTYTPFCLTALRGWIDGGDPKEAFNQIDYGNALLSAVSGSIKFSKPNKETKERAKSAIAELAKTFIDISKANGIEIKYPKEGKEVEFYTELITRQIVGQLPRYTEGPGTSPRYIEDTVKKYIRSAVQQWVESLFDKESSTNEGNVQKKKE